MDRSLRVIAVAGCLVGTTACATVPPPPPPPVISFEQKMAWMLELEDRRILRLPPPPEPEVPPVQEGRRRPPVAPPPPTSSPDLSVLVRDPEPRIRRRAALAIGRVRLAEGVAPLVATLADVDPEVRAMAAFALGLVGDRSGESALLPLLADEAPLVRGRAAEALGLMDARTAAEPVGRMVAEYARSAPVLAMQPDEQTSPAPEAEAFKLGLFALVRLRAYEPLAAAVLEEDRPVTVWWPVAYALQRIGDKRAVPALRHLLDASGRYTRAFAARGLGATRDEPSAEALLRLLTPSGHAGLEVTVAAVRALAQIQAPAAVKPLTAIVSDPAVDPNLRLEAVAALGALRDRDGLPYALDLLADRSPALRTAALRAVAAIDQESLIFALATMDPDPDWRVRAALAALLAELPPEIAVPRLRSMLGDQDRRVIPPVLSSLGRLAVSDLASILFDHLKEPDFAVRAAAIRQLGRLKPEGAAAALREAYRTALADSASGARAAALESLATFGPGEALATLTDALADRDWAIRLRAADLLEKLDPDSDPGSAIRPVPGDPIVAYDDPQLLAPAYSPHVFIETTKGTIEFELAMLDAPQTSHNFVALARKGYFNGLQFHRVVPNFVIQDGDPRGDGQGGPGYSVRDELNDRPFLRGSVGMALGGPDTGGSQFFITHSPQPHLDARYTVFGMVVNGIDVVDLIAPGDVIERVRVWDGQGWQAQEVQQKRGQTRPLFWRVGWLTASCRPSSSRPWPSSSPLSLIPPFGS
ncbi:MAG TPA: HEAT repeat domain-containing protein [Vicinamibacterales bacterium]|nr:HEAT repeat domain-containing protein [Vicinamibacterales bacterium]